MQQDELQSGKIARKWYLHDDHDRSVKSETTKKKKKRKIVINTKKM